MPKPYDYALMSLDVYQNPTDNVVLPSNWSPLLHSPGYLNNDGYYGIAYINLNSKKLVIAHRGTDDLYDVDDDAALFLQSATSQFVDSVQPFIQQVKSFLTDHADAYGTGYQLSFTGHSLGAALAELSVAQENVPGVTFDSPGTLPIINNMLGDGLLPTNALQAADTNIITYNAAPNLVNTLNVHIGTIFRIYPSYDVTILCPSVLGVNIPCQATSPASYSSYTLNQHKMGGIFAQFNFFTGLPKVMSQPTTWPVGTFTSNSGYNNFQSYARNPAFWDLYFLYKDFSKQEKTDYIKSNLGGYVTPAGVVINGDDSGNRIWGATDGADVINGGAGSDTLIGYRGNDILNGGAGQDTYMFDSDSFGHDVVNDSDIDGVIKIDGRVITGTAIETADESGVYALNMGNNRGVYLLKQSGNDLVLTTGTATSSITLKNYFVGNDQGDLKRFGIMLQKAEVTKIAIPPPSEIPPLIGVGSVGSESQNNGNSYAVAWVTNPTMVQLQNWQSASANLNVRLKTASGYASFGAIDLNVNSMRILSTPTVTTFPVALSPNPSVNCFSTVAYYTATLIHNGAAKPGGTIRLLRGVVCSDGRGDDLGPVSTSAGEYHCNQNAFYSGGYANDPFLVGIAYGTGEYTISWNCYSDTGEFTHSRTSVNGEGIYTYSSHKNPVNMGSSALNNGQLLLRGENSNGGNAGIYLKKTSNVFVPTAGNSIEASAANDVIVAEGNTIMSGNGGADTYIVGQSANARASITDFEADKQKIDLSMHQDVNSLNDLTIISGSAIVNLPNNQSIRVQNIQGTLTPQNLTEDNFIFSPPNHAPMSNCSNITMTARVGENIVIDPKNCVFDLDGDDITWFLNRYSNSSNWIQQNLNNGVITGFVPSLNNYGGIIIAKDPYGAYASIPLNISGYIPPNHAPVSNCSNITAMVPVGTQIHVNPTVCISDKDGDRLIWSLNIYSNLSSWIQLNASNGIITGVVPDTSTYGALIIASDPHGASASIPFNVTGEEAINNNHAPVVSRRIPTQTAEVGKPFQLNVSDVFTDADRDDLALQAFQKDGQALPPWVGLSANVLGGTPPAVDNLDITLRATDPHQAASNTSFNLQITAGESSNSSFFGTPVIAAVIAAGALVLGAVGLFGCHRRCKKRTSTDEGLVTLGGSGRTAEVELAQR